MVVRGIKRCLGSRPSQKLPITPAILKCIHRQLDFSKPFDIAFWAACVTAFFGFFRKSTLLPKSKNKFDPSSDLCRSDLQIDPDGAIITIRHTKTIQFHERVLEIPLPKNDNSILCPVSALQKLLRVQVPISTSEPFPLFSYSKEPCAPSWECITHANFVGTLKRTIIACGLSSSEYSGHSFRRGGASFAFSCGIPAAVIKLQGDWRSSAYERYLAAPLEMRERMCRVLSLNL